MRKTQAEFIDEMSHKHPTLTVVSQYIGSNQPIRLKCNICETEFVIRQACYALYRMKGCPKCNPHKNGREHTHEDFVRLVAKINPEIQILGHYTKVADHIQVRCRKCGKIWSPLAMNLLAGSRCPNCTRGIPWHTKEEFESLAKEYNPNVIVVGEYRRKTRPIEVECALCHRRWKTTPAKILDGVSCKYCSKKGHSLLEILTREIFESLFPGMVTCNDWKEIRMELDILVKELHFAIEVGSWYWHKNRVENDKEKQHRCASNGIRLITIYDGCRENISIEDFPDCITYEQPLIAPADCSLLKEAISHIVNDVLQFQIDLSLVDMDSIYNRISRQGILRYEKEKYLEELMHHRPDIEIIGDFLGRSAKTRFRCRTCGYEWDSIASAVLKKQACPKCMHRIPVIQGEFIEQMRKTSPNICIIGSYVKSSIPIEVECQECGHRWYSRPNSLLQGKGCPLCSVKKNADTRRKFSSYEEYEMAVCERHPHIRFIKHDYSKLAASVSYHCDCCNSDSQGLAYNLLAKGCSHCNHKKGIEKGAAKKRMNEEEFRTRLRVIRPDLEVISFSQLTKPVELRCSECQQTFTRMPYGVLKGHTKCPHCGYYKSPLLETTSAPVESSPEKTIQYVERLRQTNPTLEIVGPCYGTYGKTEVKCTICGNVWSVQLRQLFAGHGCPNCHLANEKQRRKLTREKANMRLEEWVSDWRIATDFRTKKDKVAVRCVKCGFVKHCRVDTLMNNNPDYGGAHRPCPQCKKRGHE